MTAKILDGKAASAAIKAELRKRVSALRERGITPGLGTILVGSDPGSQWYVAGKHKDCAEVGIESLRIDLPETASQADVEAAVDQLNADPTWEQDVLFYQLRGFPEPVQRRPPIQERSAGGDV